MKSSKLLSGGLWLLMMLQVFFLACTPSQNKNSNLKNMKSSHNYGNDMDFFKKNGIDFIELKNPESPASVLVVPAYQGRVMTSTSEGESGLSFGWINYDFIEQGEKNEHFNPYGGEERFWVGPEGGPYSLYFKKGTEQVYDNWVVPSFIDTESFELVEQNGKSASFSKSFAAENALGNKLQANIERKISILDRAEAGEALNFPLKENLSLVAYKTENTLTNTGDFDWTTESGVLSIWLLSMFNTSDQGVVFIPFKTGDETELGSIVSDDYFGKVPPERLLIGDGTIFFRIDGKYRSKIGISPQRALPVCGSYDPNNQVLTILMFSLSPDDSKYVNSKWGASDDLLSGDAINSYNDGPLEDGSIMGPFYEIESSSPAAFLKKDEKINHIQHIFHISGSESSLEPITEKIFGLKIEDIKNAF